MSAPMTKPRRVAGLGNPDYYHDADDIFDLIAVHAAAWARFGRAVSRTDAVAAKAAGRKITKADEAEYDAASAAEEKALHAILAVPVKGSVAMRAKALWVQLWSRYGNTMDAEQHRLLLESIAASHGAEAVS